MQDAFVGSQGAELSDAIRQMTRLMFLHGSEAEISFYVQFCDTYGLVLPYSRDGSLQRVIQAGQDDWTSYLAWLDAQNRDEFSRVELVEAYAHHKDANLIVDQNAMLRLLSEVRGYQSLKLKGRVMLVRNR